MKNTFDYILPPTALASERAVIGCMCMWPQQAVRIVAAQLTPEDFSNALYGAVMAAALKTGPTRFDRATAINAMAALVSTQDAEAAYKAAVDQAQTIQKIESHIKAVKDAASRRRFYEKIDAIRADGSTPTADLAAETIAAARDILAETGKTSGTQAEAVQQAIDRAYAPDIAYTSTGFGMINYRCIGFGQGQYHVWSGRPGAAKTQFALQSAMDVARNGGKVLYFSFEMAAWQLAQRELAAYAGVELSKLMRADLTDNDKARIEAAKDALASMDISYEYSRMTVEQIRAKIMQTPGLSLVVVDHIGLIRPSKGMRVNSTFDVITHASNALKAVALETGVPVLALSQLNRANDCEWAEPRLSQLKHSGAIEEDADVVLLLWKPALYTDYRIMAVGKNRNGAPDGYMVFKLHDTMQIEEMPHLEWPKHKELITAEEFQEKPKTGFGEWKKNY